MNPEKRCYAMGLRNGGVVADHWNRESAVCWAMAFGSDVVARCEGMADETWRAKLTLDFVRVAPRVFGNLEAAMNFCAQVIAVDARCALEAEEKERGA